MNFFSYKRLEQIFIEIYTNEFITNSTLANEYKVSERTIRNDINELNESLYPYQSAIKNKRSKGYYLTNKDSVSEIFANIKNNNNSNWLNSSEERISHLLLILLFSNKYLSVDELCDHIFVGRTTLLNYIRQLKLTLKSYDLSVKTKTNIGYKIIGEEINIRQCISEQLVEKNFEDYISQFSQNEKKLFSDIDLEEINKRVLFYFPVDLYKISDYNRKNFVIHLAIAIIRTKQEQDITTIPSLTLFDSTINQSINNLIEWVESKYNISFSEQDKRWLYSHFVTELRYQANSEEQEQKINALIEQLLTQMNTAFGENLVADNMLRNDLYIHFSSYLPLQNLLKLRKNPLLQAIKKNYSYAFELTYLTISNISSFDEYAFTEDDIAYIALHIAAAIERKEISDINQKKVIIICGQGISTSRLVEAIIKKRFATEVQVIDTVSFAKFKSLNLNHIDFIISTIPIPTLHLPVVQVDFLNMNQSLEQIETFLKSASQPQISEDLFDLFEPSLFLRNSTNDDVISIIEKMSILLNKTIKTSSTFSKKVLERESIAPTNLTSMIAMPHTIDKKLTNTKIFVCTSEKPINWQKNETVKIVFLLAIAESDKDKLQTFFEFLSELVDNLDLQNKLALSDTFDNFITTLKSTKKRD